MPRPTTVGASDVATDAIQASVQRTFQRKAFFALGRHWVFYVNDAGALVYDSSIGDSEAWLGPVHFASATSGREFSVWLQETAPTTAYVHLVWADVTGNSPVIYIRGTLASDGTISWAAENDAVALDVGYEYENLGICMGYDGYIYIVYNKVEAADPTNTTPYVCQSTTSDGTWTTGIGYPFQITAVQDGSWIPLVSPFWQEVIVVYTTANGNIYSRLLNSGAWEPQVDTGFNIGADSTKISIVSDMWIVGTNGLAKVALAVYVAFQGTDWDLYSIRYESGMWQAAPATTIEVIGPFREASPMLSILNTGDSDADHMPATLYCFWTPTTDSPNAQWVTYKVSRDFGDTWTDEGGDDVAEEWIDETGDGFEVQASGSAYSFSGSDYANAEFYIGLVYVVHRMPPCLRHAALSFADPDEDLLGIFNIRRSTTADLLGEFVIRRSASVDLAAGFVSQADANLKGIFNAGQETSADLKGIFNARQETDAILKGIFSVRRSDSENLKGIFSVRNVGTPVNLKGIFFVKQDAEDLKGIFNAGQDSTDLKGILNIRRSASANLKGGFNGQTDAILKGIFNVLNEGTAELLGIFNVRHSDSEDLKGIFNVLNEGTANLKGIFNIRRSASANLKGIFIVRQERAEELFAQFQLDKDFISKGLNVSVYRDLLVIG